MCLYPNAWFGFNWCGSFVEYMDSLQQPARQHQGGMQSHYNMSHDYFLCKRGGYTAVRTFFMLIRNPKRLPSCNIVDP
jgi:hypothetical protein